MVPPVVDHDFAQFSSLPLSDLRPSMEESMVGEQLKMLMYADCALAVGLQSTDATGSEAMDTADRKCKAIQVGLLACIALKVRANLEQNRRDKALLSLSFDSDTKVQLQTLPLGHDELLGGKLEEASKQVEKQGCCRRELKVAFKMPQAQTQATSASAPTYAFQASSQGVLHLGCSLGKGKSKKGKESRRGSAPSGIMVTYENPQAQSQGQPGKSKKKGSGHGGHRQWRGALQPKGDKFHLSSSSGGGKTLAVLSQMGISDGEPVCS